jgi:hypothetical protein
MKSSSRFTCLFAASFMAITPYTAQQFLSMAKEQVSVPEKISILKRLVESFPRDPSAHTVHEQIVNLLINTNRYEEALQEYQTDHPKPGADLRWLDLLLRTGRYNDVLRITSTAQNPTHDFLQDMNLLEFAVQAHLAKGQFQAARSSVDRWLIDNAPKVEPDSRFESDVRSLRFLRDHLATLERIEGPTGKAIFTASVSDSLQHWSHRRDIPIVFFKLIPAHPSGQLPEALIPGRHEGIDYFLNRVDELNRGFDYLSGGRFSLFFAGLHTLYIKEGDMDPESSGGHLLTSRVYVHTIPQLYKLAGEAFVVLIDYREQADDEAAYMGDGLIHLSASKLETLVMMHEILHGLGATHQEWNALEAQGYKFDPEDRGLMTFDHGEILDLGLEEKNRALLGWPQVGVIRPHATTGTSLTEGLRNLGKAIADQAPAAAPVETTAQRPSSSDLLPNL